MGGRKDEKRDTGNGKKQDNTKQAVTYDMIVCGGMLVVSTHWMPSVRERDRVKEREGEGESRTKRVEQSVRGLYKGKRGVTRAGNGKGGDGG
jgi:hypothetical protein